jgi:hypothetical protein
VKQFAAISLLFIFSLTILVPSTIWGDLGKIANLIEHYKEHKKEDSSISFWAFLDLHYGSDFQKHQTAHDHSKLPLKSTQHAIYSHILLSDIYQSNLNIAAKWVAPEKKQALPFFNQSFISRSLTDIWQPPRVS